MGKSRKSISVKGLTYFRIREYCKRHDVAISAWVGGKVDRKLKGAAPDGFDLYEARSGSQIFMVFAQSSQQVLDWVSRKTQTLPGVIAVSRSMKRWDPAKFTFGHVGILTQEEWEEVADKIPTPPP